jgi:hypothetical protein
MATKEVKSYVYKNVGEEQKIKGIGLVRKGETITVPYNEVDHKDLELVKTVTSYEDDGEEPESEKK